MFAICVCDLCDRYVYAMCLNEVLCVICLRCVSRARVAVYMNDVYIRSFYVCDVFVRFVSAIYVFEMLECYVNV